MAGRRGPSSGAAQPAAHQPRDVHRRPGRQGHVDHAGDGPGGRQQRRHARRLDARAGLRRTGRVSLAARAVRRTVGIKRRSLLILAAITLGAAAVTLAAFHNITFLTQAELFVDDVRTAASTFMRREPQDPRVVIVAVTEDTLAQFPYRSPVDRAFLARLLR